MTVKQKMTWAIAIAVVAILAWLVRDGWQGIVGALTGAKWYFAAASIVVLSVANVQVGLVFAAVASRYSERRLQSGPVLGAFLVSQVAKYVPGRIWGVAMQAVMLQSSGSAAALIVANIELSILVLVVVSGVGLACVAGWEWGLVAAGPILLCAFGVSAVALKLSVGAWLLRLRTRLPEGIRRLLAEENSTEEVHNGDSDEIGIGTFVNLAGYIALYLLGCGLLVASVSVLDVREVLAVVAAMSLSYVVGALSMLPGGLGAREGAMLLLAPAVGFGHEEMAALALVSRAALVLVDAVAAVTGAWLLKREPS